MTAALNVFNNVFQYDEVSDLDVFGNAFEWDGAAVVPDPTIGFVLSRVERVIVANRSPKIWKIPERHS